MIQFDWRAPRLAVLLCVLALCVNVSAHAKTIMVWAPHPDDETLMAAGIIRSAVLKGDRVILVVFTNGDTGGQSMGLAREVETVNVMAYLGVPSQDVIFLGYGDALLNTLYFSPSPLTIYTSQAGLTATYANQGHDSTDFHNDYFKQHGAYNRATALLDVQTLVDVYRPDDIYVTSLYDNHQDHSSTYLFLMEGLANLRAAGRNYGPVVHQSIIHPRCAGCDWPMPAFTPATPFPQPPGLEATPLAWSGIESVTVPESMQNPDPALNMKNVAINMYSTVEWLHAFVKQNEFFWVQDLGRNLALQARVTVSSEDVAASQTGAKAVDGLITGAPFFNTAEWSTGGQLAGAWIRLAWPAPVQVARVILHDSPFPGNQVLAGTLEFSDGTSLAVGALPDNGVGLPIAFDPKTVSWVQFNITSATGSTTGLAEIEVFPTPPVVPPAAVNLARTASVTVSSENPSTGQLGVKAIDGAAIGYPNDYTKEWATQGEMAGAGIKLAWVQPVTVSDIVLYDRPNLADHVLAGTLSFSDGTTLNVGALPDDGTAFPIPLATAKTITWVKFTVTSAVGLNIGLSEFEVYGVTGSPLPAPANLARSASVTVSSMNTATDQLGAKAIDGVTDGYPGDYTKEWATQGELGGAFLRLAWSAPVAIASINLYDRPNLTDHILAGTLQFSDGSTAAVGALPNDGSVYTIPLPSPKTVSWLQFNITSAAGMNTGLSEIEVFAADSPPAPTISNLAPGATASVSSENASTGQLGAKIADGVINGYPGDYTREWATLGEQAGAYARLTWNQPVTLSSINLYDRPNLTDNVLGGTLQFSDGSSVAVPALPPDGSAYSIVLPGAKTVTWVQFTITAAEGWNTGLSEFEAFGK